MQRIQQFLSQNESMDASALKCVLCENFLSVSPIVYNEILGSICGRENCAKLAKSKGTNYQQSAYEVLAKYLSFPCMYEKDGCPEQLGWDEIGKHEMHCKFGISFCPFATDRFEKLENWLCPWRGETSTLLNHMEEAHPTHKFENYVQLDFETDIETNQLMFARIQDSIVVLLSVIDQKPNFHLEVWSGPELYGNLKYEIEFSNEGKDHMTSSILRSAKLIHPNFCVSKINYSWPEIHPDVFSYLFKSASLTIKFYFDGLLIDPLEKLYGNYEDLLLDNNDCECCADNLSHPIYLCEGFHHKVCYDCMIKWNNCNTLKKKCPKCESKIKKIHQPSEPVLCLICQEKTNCVSSHLFNHHKESICQLDEYYNINFDESLSNIFCFDDNIFILRCSFGTEGFRFGVKCLGLKDIKYKFDLKLLTLRTSISSLTLSDFCYPEKMCSDNLNRLSVSLLIQKNWLDKNASCVPFKLNIFRI